MSDSAAASRGRKGGGGKHPSQQDGNGEWADDVDQEEDW